MNTETRESSQRGGRKGARWRPVLLVIVVVLCAGCRPGNESPPASSTNRPSRPAAAVGKAAPALPSVPSPAPTGLGQHLPAVPGWTAGDHTESRRGDYGARTYKSGKKQVMVRLWTVKKSGSATMLPYDIGFKKLTRSQHVEMIKVGGYPAFLNHHRFHMIGTLEVTMLDGRGKIDFSYRNMDIDEVKKFAQALIPADMEKKIVEER